MMKRTLLMLVAALAMTAVASVQAADVKVNLQNRDANQNMVAAQNVKYSISNAAGEIVAEGEGSEIALDLAEGAYEITVEQTAADGKTRYGVQTMNVPAEGAEYTFDVSPEGLTEVNEVFEVSPVITKTPAANRCKCKYCGCNGTREYCRDHCDCPYCDCGGAVAPIWGGQTSYPYMAAGNNWGVLGLAGALVATAIALGVDDDHGDRPARPVTPRQFNR